MKTFTTLPLHLTPLTPIHIGCGIDFEPTDYVIDDGLLLHFDPARLQYTPEDRRELAQVVSGSARADEVIRRVQQFFFQRRERLVAVTRDAIPVTGGVTAWYDARVGKVVQAGNGNRSEINQLEIERTAHHPHTSQAYLPGSSLKGAMRTGWLNHIDHCKQHPVGRRNPDTRASEKASDLERELLGGSFDTDPFRLVKLADAHGDDVRKQIVLALNRHREQPAAPSTPLPEERKNLFVRREVVLGGQYRGLASELRIDSLGDREWDKAPAKRKRIDSVKTLAKACNAFYLTRMRDELGLLNRRRFAEGWVEAFRKLIEALERRLLDGEAMLLRVGRHSGADSVTLARHRWIEIKGGKKRPRSWKSTPTTLWLAGSDIRDRSELLPFGWLLIEPAGSPEVAELRHWCDMEPKPDLTEVRARLRVARDEAEAREAEMQERARERAAQEAEAAKVAREREAHLASLGVHARQVEDLRERFARHAGPRQVVSGALYAEVHTLLKNALDDDWEPTDKRLLADLVMGTAFDKIDFGGKAKEIRRKVNQLIGSA